MLLQVFAVNVLFLFFTETHFRTQFHVWLIKITLYKTAAATWQCAPLWPKTIIYSCSSFEVLSLLLLLLFITPSNRKYNNTVASFMQVCTHELVSGRAGCQQQCSLKATVILSGRCEAVAPLEANIHFDENYNCITLTQVKATVTATKTSLRSCAGTKVCKNQWNFVPCSLGSQEPDPPGRNTHIIRLHSHLGAF